MRRRSIPPPLEPPTIATRSWRSWPLVLVGGLALLFPLATIAAGQPAPVLVADLATVEVNGDAFSSRDGFASVELGGQIYFAAHHPQLGTELWMSDGTPEGTELIRDICPGLCSSRPRSLVVLGGKIFFRASDGVFGHELWVSDGTEAGTRLAVDVCPGPCHGLGTDFFDDPFPVSGGAFYFSGLEPIAGRELWKSDGTEAGTERVSDLCPGPCGSTPILEAATPNQLFFLAQPDPLLFHRLYRTDGTTGGILEIADRLSLNLQIFDEDLLFSSYDPDAGNELWRSDGTPEGTARLADICPGDCSGLGSTDHFLGIFEDRVYFNARGAPAAVNSVFRTDASPEGTEIVLPDFQSVGLVEFRDQLFFTGYRDGCQGLWRGDGSEWLTCTGALIQEIVNVGDERLFFTTYNSLFTSLDTPESVEHLKVFDDANPSNPPRALTPLGSRVLFGAREGDTGAELWVSDGTADGTHRVADIHRGPGSARPMEITALGDTVLFAAAGADEPGIYRSDGTAAGTFRLPTGPTHLVDGLFPWNGKLLYADPREPGLWQTDGTVAGTVLISAEVLRASGLANAGGLVYFAAETTGDGSVGVELWVTDGSAAGTRLVRDILPPDAPTQNGSAKAIIHYPPSSNPREIVALGNGVIFVADNALWTSDGTTEGTVAVDEACTTACPSDPEELTPLGGRVLFSAFDAAAGRELWSSDGSSAGTVRLTDLNPGNADSSPHGLTRLDDGVIFFASSGGGEELFIHDGTTRRLSVLGPAPTFVTEVERAGSRVFFTVAHPGTGIELWVSDGTAAGTRSLGPAAGDYPSSLTAVDGQLLYAAHDPAHGKELWISDGMSGDTRRLTDLAPGPLPSTPASMTAAGPWIFFAADGAAGRELHVLDRVVTTEIFTDGFETGNLASWSVVTP